jgi:type I restriction enzyme M protein
MITGELKSRVDRIWDTMWSGGISNPLSVIEQLTYLLFIKRLDELHILQEWKATRTRTPIDAPIFTEDQAHLRKHGIEIGLMRCSTKSTALLRTRLPTSTA